MRSYNRPEEYSHLGMLNGIKIKKRRGMYSYIEEFMSAVLYSKKYNQIDFRHFVNNRYFNDANIVVMAEAINKRLDDIPKDKYPSGMRSIGISNSIIANCGPFHYFVKDTVEKVFNCSTYLTLGYISLGEERFFHKITLEELENAFKTKKFPDHHIWLTMDSGEILDLTFILTYRSINDRREFESDLLYGVPLYPVAKHPNDLVEGMQYHPIAVGIDILKRAGYHLDKLAKILY